MRCPEVTIGVGLNQNRNKVICLVFSVGVSTKENWPYE